MDKEMEAKVLLVDDEQDFLETLSSRLELRGLKVSAVTSGEQAVSEAKEDEYDAIVVDLSMPGIDGLETARRLGALQPRPAIVFCTAFDAHALSAFEAQALDYLVKPVRAERQAQALDKARTFLAGRDDGGAGTPGRDHLCARLRGSLRLIPIDDIRYLQAEEKYVVVHHARGEDLIEESLKSLEDEFAERFVRIHRNCLVARNEIVELRRAPDGHAQAVLRSGGTPLEVSRRCVAQLRDTLRHL